MRVFLLHINAALEVKNRVQFAWAKTHAPYGTSAAPSLVSV